MIIETIPNNIFLYENFHRNFVNELLTKNHTSIMKLHITEKNHNFC